MNVTSLYVHAHTDNLSFVLNPKTRRLTHWVFFVFTGSNRMQAQAYKYYNNYDDEDTGQRNDQLAQLINNECGESGGGGGGGFGGGQNYGENSVWQQSGDTNLHATALDRQQQQQQQKRQRRRHNETELKLEDQHECQFQKKNTEVAAAIVGGGVGGGDHQNDLSSTPVTTTVTTVVNSVLNEDSHQLVSRKREIKQHSVDPEQYQVTRPSTISTTSRVTATTTTTTTALATDTRNLPSDKIRAQKQTVVLHRVSFASNESLSQLTPTLHPSSTTTTTSVPQPTQPESKPTSVQHDEPQLPSTPISTQIDSEDNSRNQIDPSESKGVEDFNMAATTTYVPGLSSYSNLDADSLANLDYIPTMKVTK